MNTADFPKPERSGKSEPWPRWIACGLFALAVLTLASWTLLQQYTSRALSRGLDRSLADSVDRVVTAVEARGALAAMIADRPEMRALLRELADRPDDAALRARLRQEVRQFSAHGFGAIELLAAADGRRLAAIGELDRASRPSLPVLSQYDIELRWTPSAIVLRFRQRIGDERGPLAELVADQPLSRMRPVAEDEPWLQLCRPVDGDLECFPERDGDTLQRIPSSRLPAPLRDLLASKRLLPDSDPAFVVGNVAYEPIAELGLVAALNVDRVVRYAPLRDVFQVSVLGLILLMCGGGWLLRRQLTPLASRLLAAQAYATEKAAELRSREALLRVIYEEAPQGIALLDADRRIVMANARAAQLFGYPSLVGMQAEQLRPVEERAQRARLLDHAFSRPGDHQRPATYSVNGLRHDGRVIPLEVVPSPIEVDGRRMIMMMVSDVTERRIAELSLRESEQRFRNTMEHAPIGMALIALSGHWLEVNAAVCSMTGYSAQELRRLRFQDITHRDDLIADLDQVSQLVEGRISSYQMEKRYIHRQGHVIWALLAGSLVRDADGKPLYFIAQIKDAGERLRLRAALALQSAIVDSAHASIIGIDADGFIVSFNKAAQRLLGYREDEVVGRMRAEALHDEQEMAAHAAWLTERFGRRVDTGFEALTAYLRVHDADHREWLYVRKDGVRVPVLLSSTALHDENGRITGFLGIASDISQQKRNESELKAALEEKETLLREVYHRVKNNLQVVGSLFNLQLRSLPPGPAHAALADAADRVRTMALLHEKLYRSPTLSAIDLDDYFGDLLNRIAVSTGAAERGIDVQSHCVRLQIGLDTAVPLGLIANELVGNALKHAFPNARSGRVRLRVEIDGDSIVLSVDDDGVGLPADGRHLSSASLGLVLVRSLSSQLDADFTLESSDGTLARLRLSRSRGSIAPETDFGASHRKKGPASGAGEQ